MASMAAVAFSPPSSSWGLSSSFPTPPSLFLRLPSATSTSKAPSFSTLSQRWRRPVSATSLEEAPVVDVVEDAGSEPAEEAAEKKKKNRIEIPKGEEIFAVVMVGSRQYIVFPGRYIYTQRLKGANANDKIILNKVLLVGTKTSAYIGKPVVTNAAVHAVVEEQGLNKKVIVFKYKKKKNYRRNIGHRQPNTRIRITGITGYEDYPAATLPA